MAFFDEQSIDSAQLLALVVRWIRCASDTGGRSMDIRRRLDRAIARAACSQFFSSQLIAPDDKTQNLLKWLGRVTQASNADPSKSNCADALVSSSRQSEAGHTELGPLTGRAHQTARPQCEYSQPADSQLSALNSHLSTLNSQLFLLSPLNSQLPTFDHANHASQSTTPAASLSGIQLIAYS